MQRDGKQDEASCRVRASSSLGQQRQTTCVDLVNGKPWDAPVDKQASSSAGRSSMHLQDAGKCAGYRGVSWNRKVEKETMKGAPGREPSL
jgi:hypothetical protein